MTKVTTWNYPTCLHRIAFNNAQMLKNILDYSEEEYEQKREVFMQKMQYYDDGHASEAVVDYILEHTK